MKSKIHYTKPSITELEVSYVTDAARNGWGEQCYQYIIKFEEKFKDFSAAEYVLATSSCTGALHMGLAALDVSLGDEIILADTNWIASAAPITYLGAKPVFIDILPDSWCLDPDLIEAAITPKTKAILATHIYGNLCEMDLLLSIGEKYGIPIIEDAAEAIGSYWSHSHAGTLGKFGVFSFHGTKTITTGEGGVFVTNDENLYERVLTLSNHGRSRNQAKQFYPDVVGFKYKMSNIQAAIGCAQMSRINELVTRKKEILNYYKENFKNLSGVSMNPEPEGRINGAWMPTIVFEKSMQITSDILQSRFEEENIDARVFFHPLSSLPMFKNNKSNINAWDIPKRSINLPSYHDMTESELDRIISVVLEITNK